MSYCWRWHLSVYWYYDFNCYSRPFLSAQKIQKLKAHISSLTIRPHKQLKELMNVAEVYILNYTQVKKLAITITL